MAYRSFFCRVARPPAIPAVALAVVLGAAPLHAGIMRDVLEDLHIVKPPPPAAPAAGEQMPPFQGFACCNLHYDGRSISDTNYASLPMIPAGTPIEVVAYDKHKASIKVDGKPLQLSQVVGPEIVDLRVAQGDQTGLEVLGQGMVRHGVMNQPARQIKLSY